MDSAFSIEDPFAIHRAAFKSELEGDVEAACELFGRALAGFSELLQDPGFRARLERRAARVPSLDESPAELAAAFFEELPSWLVDYHVDRLSKALSSRLLSAARTHWLLLERAARLPGLRSGSPPSEGEPQPAVDLELLRDLLCQRFLPENLIETPDGRKQLTDNAERLVRVDPGNISARLVALKAYTWDLGLGLDALLPNERPARRSKRRSRACATDLVPKEELKPRSLRRLRSRLRRGARRLRRHATVLARTSQRKQPELAQGFLELCRYYAGMSEYSTALRMARRARRLQPEDPQIRGLARLLRRRGKGR